MLLTVKDVLHIDVMKSSKVLTAQDTLEKRYVESISVIEIPVDNFVRKNELVLSTAIGCGHDPQLFKGFVKDIISSEAAALALAIGPYVTEIPSEVLELAEKEEFPIIEIPWELRFSDIIHKILSEINNWQRVTLRHSEEMQKELLNLFLRKANLSMAAEVIRQKTGKSILFLEKDGTIRGKSKNSKALTKVVEEGSPSTFSWKPTHSSHHVTQNVIRWTKWKEHEIILQVIIRSAHVVQGYLLLSLSNEATMEEFLTSDKELMLQHAATSAALWFQRENTIKETEMRLRDDFVWGLAKDEVDSWDITDSRAKLLGFNIDLPYVCILGLPENLEVVFQTDNLDQIAYEYWLQDMVRQIEEKIIHVGKKLQKKIMTTYQQNRFIIFIETSEQLVSSTVNAFLDLMEGKIKQLYPTLTLSWGIGENHVGKRTFHKSFHDAKLALEIGSRQKGPGQRNTYASTGIYRVLQCLANNDEIHSVVLSTIGGLVVYDKDRGLDLIRTLMVYIRNRGNVSQTARELNLHRQSLLYRLGKIEALTGLLLTESDDLFLLDLSIKLWTTGQFDTKKEND